MNQYVFYAILSGALAGTNGMIGRILTEGGMSSTEIGTCRFAITTVIYFVAALREGSSSLKIRWKDLWIFLGTGAVGQLLYSVLFFSAVNIMPLSVASTISLTWPFFVIFLAWIFFRESLTVQKLLGAALAFGGCALCSGALGGARPPLRGVLLALGSGLSYSIYSICSRAAMQRGYTLKTINFYTWLFAFLGSRLFWPADRPFVHMFSRWENVAACLFIGVMVGYVSSHLYLKALTKLDAGKASVLTFSSPVVAAILGILIYREPVTLWQAAGVSLILVAMLILNRKSPVPAHE